MEPLTTADLAEMIRDLQQQISREFDARARVEEEFRRVLILLANQSGDLTHASVETAAKILGCSTRSVHRRIKSGEYTLEVIPGTKRYGIAVDQLTRLWCPVAIARRAFERQREQEEQAHGPANRG